MVKNKIKGSIINLNSTYGLLGQDMNIYEKTGMRENMPYSMIKGGLVNLTRQMASYYGRFGVRVNSICSGGLKDMWLENQVFKQSNSLKIIKKRFHLVD